VALHDPGSRRGDGHRRRYNLIADQKKLADLTAGSASMWTSKGTKWLAFRHGYFIGQPNIVEIVGEAVVCGSSISGRRLGH